MVITKKFIRTICSSTDTHAAISIEAIQAGKHVFCEKPVDLSIPKIHEVEAALAAAPKKLCYQVGFNRRFDRYKARYTFPDEE